MEIVQGAIMKGNFQQKAMNPDFNAIGIYMDEYHNQCQFGIMVVRMPWVAINMMGSLGNVRTTLRFNGTCGVKDNEEEIDNMCKFDSGMLFFHPRNIWSPK